MFDKCPLHVKPLMYNDRLNSDRSSDIYCSYSISSHSNGELLTLYVFNQQTQICKSSTEYKLNSCLKTKQTNKKKTGEDLLVGNSVSPSYSN